MIKRFGAVSQALIALLFAGVLCSPAHASALEPFHFDGVWEGSMRGCLIRQDNEKPDWVHETSMRLTFSDGTVAVHTKYKSDWQEIKPGQFRFDVLDTNAVVSAISSGADSDGRWVETWSFAVTGIDATHMHVQWQRLVRNKDLPSTDKNAAWGTFGYGVLERVDKPGS